MRVELWVAERPENHGERFLYLYLSLMISIFCIITLMSLRSATNDKSLSYEAVGAPSEGAHTLFGARDLLIAKEPLSLFTTSETEEGFEVSPAGFQSIVFLLKAHNIWGIVRISGDSERPEGALARALALQAHLDKSGFTAHDVRVEVSFDSNGGSEAELLLFSLDMKKQTAGMEGL